jgi:subtilisin family serine protease
VAVPVLGIGAAAADSPRVHYTGELLVAIQGPAEEVERVTDALTLRPDALGVGRRARVLFDSDSAGDGCPDPAALRGPTTQIDRVLVLPAGSVADLRAATAASAWDEAYGKLGLGSTGPRPPDATLLAGLATANVRVVAVEPDLVWIDDEMDAALTAHHESAAADRRWPAREAIDWHLEASELSAGRALVESRLSQQRERVSIAHFDTGFSPCRDGGLPPRLDTEHSWDFTAPRCADGVCAPSSGGAEPRDKGLIKSGGHGTGTLSILAGGRVRLQAGGRPPFDGVLGAAPFADVVEYRLSDLVVIWRPSVVAQALRWAASHAADVVSMSMGGAPSFTLHQAVNTAYCAGVAIVSAAGNNVALAFSPSTPRTTVFPARYHRVLSAGGVTADTATYAVRPWRWQYLWKPWQVVMRGNFGPNWTMDETLVAWTPNVPWLEYRHEDQCDQPPRIRLNGAGTSAATPQVAGAAAQWLQYHRDDPFLRAHWRGWQKTESVYQALLQAADRGHPSAAYNRQWFGAGIVRAATAITNGVPHPSAPRPAARLGWDWLASLLLGDGVRRGLVTDAAPVPALENMVRTEVAQLMITAPEVSALLAGRDPFEPADPKTRRRILRQLAEEGSASRVLRNLARTRLASDA